MCMQHFLNVGAQYEHQARSAHLHHIAGHSKSHSGSAILLLLRPECRSLDLVLCADHLLTAQAQTIITKSLSSLFSSCAQEKAWAKDKLTAQCCPDECDLPGSPQWQTLQLITTCSGLSIIKKAGAATHLQGSEQIGSQKVAAGVSSRFRSRRSICGRVAGGRLVPFALPPPLHMLPSFLFRPLPAPVQFLLTQKWSLGSGSHLTG